MPSPNDDTNNPAISLQYSAAAALSGADVTLTFRQLSTLTNPAYDSANPSVNDVTCTLKSVARTDAQHTALAMPDGTLIHASDATNTDLDTVLSPLICTTGCASFTGTSGSFFFKSAPQSVESTKAKVMATWSCMGQTGAEFIPSATAEDTITVRRGRMSGSAWLPDRASLMT